jgi:hypothetical protein
MRNISKSSGLSGKRSPLNLYTAVSVTLVAIGMRVDSRLVDHRNVTDNESILNNRTPESNGYEIRYALRSIHRRENDHKVPFSFTIASSIEMVPKANGHQETL